MKSSKELIELRDAKVAEAEAFINGIEGEQTPEQKSQVDAFMDEVDALNEDIKRAKRIEETLKKEAKAAANAAGHKPSKGEENELDKIAERFTFGEAVRAVYGLNHDSGIVAEVTQEGEAELSRIGKTSKQGSVVIPTTILNRMGNAEKRAVITENSTTGIDTSNFVQSVYARTILSDLGATFIDAVQDVRVPIIGAVTTVVEGETDNTADGGSASSKVDLTPVRIAAYVDYSKQAAMQSNFSLEQALRNAIESSLAAKVESCVFTSTAGAWDYIGTGKSQAGGTSDNAYKMAIAVYEEVMGNNHDMGSLGFAASHSLLTPIMEGVQVSGVSALYDPVNRTIFGFPVRFSTQIADIASGKESMYFGDWSKYWVAQFGGVEILLDPYTQSVGGKDRLVLNSYWDGALIQDPAISVDGYDG